MRSTGSARPVQEPGSEFAGRVLCVDNANAALLRLTGCRKAARGRNRIHRTPTRQLLFADIRFDEAIGTDATVPAFSFDGLRFLSKFTVNQLDGLNLVEPENSLGSIISPLGTAAGLPAMHIQLAIIANRDLVHIDKPRQTALADIIVIDEFDDPTCFRRLAERGFIFRLGEGR